MHNRLFLLTIIILTLSGCSKTPYIPYHSTAGIPHETRMVQTEMVLINSESDDTNRLTYAVIAALDNNNLPYLIIAPSMSSYLEPKDLWDYNISSSTTIHPDKAQDLIESLRLIIRKWDSDIIPEEGYFFEFTHTPEHQIFPQSPNVETSFPTIRVNFNITAKGSKGALVIGRGELGYGYVFNSKQAVQKFQNLLKRGLEKLDKMVE